MGREKPHKTSGGDTAERGDAVNKAAAAHTLQRWEEMPHRCASWMILKRLYQIYPLRQTGGKNNNMEGSKKYRGTRYSIGRVKKGVL